MASCHTHAAFQGVHLSPLGFAACQSKNCTNQARSAPTKLPLHPPTARDFCTFCVFRGTILRNLNICVHLCHLWEDYLGLPHAPTQGVQLSQLHQPSSHCIFPQNSQNFLAEENFCVFCVFRGTILRNLNICVRLCHLWENTIMAGGVGMAGMPYPPKCVL